MKTLSVLFMSVLLFAGCTPAPCDCEHVKSDSTSVISDSVKVDSVKTDSIKVDTLK